MRRADYSHGRGRLWVAHGRLLFVNDAEHPATESLERAAQADRPSRALATAVIAADFDVPPFVFAEDGERLTGIVCGTIEVHVDDTEPTVVNGADADPWAQVEASPAAVVSTGLDAPDDSHEVLWLESGAVRAGSFRWMPDAVAAGDVETASSRRARSSEPPPDDHRGPGTLPSRSPEPILNADPDATVDASAAIKMLSDAAATAASAPASLDVDSEATIGLAPGEILFDSSPQARRSVEALVCSACSTPNPPTAARCRKCSSLLSSSDSATRRIPQPVLGVIHLSGGLSQPLDADLLIGRNPAPKDLGAHQRAVVHGEGDRSVSRRHIELRLDGWNVMATNFKKGSSTTVESRDGVCSKLLTGVARQLNPGDTIHFGSSWLRFEPEE